ncbi:hypothetical protein RBU61_00560 [Tissierella sp. MB52-C2]|uniref:hypothetical protein n=1 Tax=Tissierella sp. MB52-C2 TaxID=3070999 RepID=UPI00280B9745|nr:hypothetical protein [Tissierella sp. MB52-C2]WMM25182.1 hypothetical protein RBU61_00560 [Tissierella sp. MB52-C2]
MAKVRRTRYIVCLFTGFISGVLMGIAVFTTLVSYRIDEYHKTIIYLENTIEDRDAKLEKLEQTISDTNMILKDIEIKLIFDGDEIDRIDIEKSIKEKYNTLIGKEVKSIDTDILSEVVDKRIFKIEKKEYKLKVEKLILTEILKIYVSVELKE